MSIVVGIDGSAASAAALRWAVREAVIRGTSVQAVHAWHASFTSAEVAPPDHVALESAARRTMESTVAVVDASSLAQPLGLVVVRGVAASALLDVARDAELVVVGMRAGHTLGSVARQVVAHAPCPVVVVPAA